MSRINPEGQITRKERLVAVIAVIGAVLVHLVALFGLGRISQWAQEEQKKERLMVIRRVRDIAPPRETISEPARQRPGPAGTEGAAGGGKKAAPPPPPDPKVKDQGAEPPPEADLSPAMEQELQEQQQPDASRALEQGDNSVSVVTDLPGASFIVTGAAEYRGSGTFWVRKGAPPGAYTVTFNPVAGFATPPVQSKELAAKGQIVFVGKYRRSTELVVDSNEAGAQFTIYRPDGRPLELNRLGRALLDDLPPGTYTAVFKDLAGHVTPAPQSRSLAPGGKLSFYAEYLDAPGGQAGGAGGPGTGARGAGSGAGGYGRGTGGGSSGAGAVKAPVKTAAVAKDTGLDRRVQIVVSSYPQTRIDDNYDAIPYPEMVIRKSNFQQGWCQVYLVLFISDRGDVVDVLVERPRPEERSRFEALIKAVENAARAWDYDKVNAEVHVDVRFYVE